MLNGFMASIGHNISIMRRNSKFCYKNDIIYNDKTKYIHDLQIMDNNMPMWAHYANNHGGYCVKYSVLNSDRIFPVVYEPIRTKSAVIVV